MRAFCGSIDKTFADLKKRRHSFLGMSFFLNGHSSPYASFLLNFPTVVTNKVNHVR